MSDSYFLFAGPSFATGIARNIDLSGCLNEYNTSATEKEADYFALQNDWRAVGKDILVSISIIEGEIDGQKRYSKEQTTTQ